MVSGAAMRPVGGVKGLDEVSMVGKVARGAIDSEDSDLGGSSERSTATVLLLPRGLLKVLAGEPAFRSGLVRGLLVGLKTSLNFRTGDLFRILLMLFRRRSRRRESALSIRPGTERFGVDSETGGDFGDGEDSGSAGSTSVGTL